MAISYPLNSYTSASTILNFTNDVRAQISGGTGITYNTGTVALTNTGSVLGSTPLILGQTAASLSGLTNLSSSTLTASSVDINGGTVDGTTIGATTPSSGRFTTLSASGNTTLAGDLTIAGNVTLGDAQADRTTFLAAVNIYSSSAGNHYLAFYPGTSANAFAFALDSIGRVGIGGKNPSTTLDVSGTFYSRGAASFDNTISGASTLQIGGGTTLGNTLNVVGTTTAARISATQISASTGFSGSGASIFDVTGSNIKNFTSDVRAQFSGGIGIAINSGVISASNVPNTSLQNSAVTINGTSVSLGSSINISASTSGTAGGDLSGTYPNPTVAKIQGIAVSGALPTNGQVLKYVAASSSYVPLEIAGDIEGVLAGTNLTGGGTSGTVTLNLTSSIVSGLDKIAGLSELTSSFVSASTATIAGGTINNTTIGVTTQAAGNFTTLSASNTLQAGGNTTLGGDLTVRGNILLGNESSDTSTISGSFNVSGSITQTGGNFTTNGNAFIQGGSLGSSASSFNLLQFSPVAILNIGGAATTIEIGASTGTTSVNNNLTVDGNTTLGNGSADVARVSGSLLVSGSISGSSTLDIGAAATLGSTLNVSGATTATTISATQVSASTGFSGSGAYIFDVTGSNIKNFTTDVRSQFSGGVGIVINSGVISASAVPNTSLQNNSITINGTSTQLGGAVTTTAAGTNLSSSTSAGTVTLSLNNNITGLTSLTSSFLSSSTLTTNGSANIGGNLTVTGDLTINGTTTTINSTTLTVDDKNIVLAATATPTDAAADGGGITLSGSTDKTLNWVNSTTSWTSNQNFDLASGKTYKINGTDVLSSTALGSTVVGSSLTSVGTLTSLNVNGNTKVTGTLGVTTSVSSSAITGSFSGSGASVFGITASNISNFTNDVRAQFSAGTGISITAGAIGLTSNSTTLGTTALTLGSSTTTLRGLTELTSSFVSASTATVAGTLNANGGTIATTATTFSLANTTATTLNIGGAATTIEIGAATGTSSINNDLTVDGNTRLGNASTDNTTVSGSLRTSGSISGSSTLDIGGAATLGSTLNVVGAFTASGNSYIGDNADDVRIQNNKFALGASPTSGEVIVYNGTAWANSSNLTASILKSPLSTGNDVFIRYDSVSGKARFSSNLGIDITSTNRISITGSNDTILYGDDYTYLGLNSALSPTLIQGATITISPEATTRFTGITTNFETTNLIKANSNTLTISFKASGSSEFGTEDVNSKPEDFTTPQASYFSKGGSHPTASLSAAGSTSSYVEIKAGSADVYSSQGIIKLYTVNENVTGDSKIINQTRFFEKDVAVEYYPKTRISGTIITNNNHTASAYYPIQFVSSSTSYTMRLPIDANSTVGQDITIVRVGAQITVTPIFATASTTPSATTTFILKNNVPTKFTYLSSSFYGQGWYIVGF